MLTTNYPKATGVLERFKKYVVTQSKRNLTSQFKRGSGSLHKSIKGKVLKTANRGANGRFTGGSSVPSLQFEMNHYGAFVDSGVQGSVSSKSVERTSKFKFRNNKKSVPVKAIREWLRRKGQLRKKKGLEYVIARSIYQKGIKKSLFFTKPFKTKYPTMIRQYHSALADDIAINIANRLKKETEKKIK